MSEIKGFMADYLRKFGSAHEEAMPMGEYMRMLGDRQFLAEQVTKHDLMIAELMDKSEVKNK